MTTIAISNAEIAADTHSFVDGIRNNVNKQKIRTQGGYIYALAGSAQVFDAAIQWHLNGAKPEDVPKYGDWNLIIITAEGTFFCSQDMPFLGRLELPQAFGSGGAYALGALDYGASARDAVKTAMVRDPLTGGDIQVVRFADVFVKDRAEAAE